MHQRSLKNPPAHHSLPGTSPLDLYPSTEQICSTLGWGRQPNVQEQLLYVLIRPPQPSVGQASLTLGWGTIMRMCTCSGCTSALHFWSLQNWVSGLEASETQCTFAVPGLIQVSGDMLTSTSGDAHVCSTPALMFEFIRFCASQRAHLCSDMSRSKIRHEKWVDVK